MPSTATITSFYSFSANTKARASQVNNNFDIFRGHSIPVSPSTQTASHNTYDLGSSEYYWRSLYAGDLNIGATSASWKIIDETTSGSGGDLLFKQNGIEKFRITDDGLTATRLTNTIGVTTSASGGNIAERTFSDASPYSTANTPRYIAGSTITLNKIARPVLVSLNSYGFIMVKISNTASVVSGVIAIHKDTVTSFLGLYNYKFKNSYNTSTSDTPYWVIPFGVSVIDPSTAATTTVNYFCSMYPSFTGDESNSVYIDTTKITAIQL